MIFGINATRNISKLSQITYNNFEISLVVFMSNITANHTITYTNSVRGDSQIKGAGMLVVSLRGVNFRFWSRLGCSGQNTIIFSRKGHIFSIRFIYSIHAIKVKKDRF